MTSPKYVIQPGVEILQILPENMGVILSWVEKVGLLSLCTSYMSPSQYVKGAFCDRNALQGILNGVALDVLSSAIKNPWEETRRYFALLSDISRQEVHGFVYLV